jgi:hypothetical protein
MPSYLFPGSPYRIPISSAILQLQEAGRLHILKTRWWKERRGGGQCKVSHASCIISSNNKVERAARRGTVQGSPCFLYVYPLIYNLKTIWWKERLGGGQCNVYGICRPYILKERWWKNGVEGDIIRYRLCRLYSIFSKQDGGKRGVRVDSARQAMSSLYSQNKMLEQCKVGYVVFIS